MLNCVEPFESWLRYSILEVVYELSLIDASLEYDMMKKTINTLLRKIGVELHGLGYLEKLRNSDTQKSAWQKQKQLIQKDRPIIFDVGANRGDTVQKYIELFPQAHIHAFEPFPESFSILQDNCSSQNITINQVALSNRVQVDTMNVNRSVDTNSLLTSKRLGASSDKYCETVGQVEIQTDTLDNYCRDRGIGHIDILKMDVQGAELRVLEGGLNMLKGSKVGLIYLETYFQQQYIDQPLFHEIAQFLYGKGFTLQDIYNPYYSSTQILWCDCIFVRE